MVALQKLDAKRYEFKKELKEKPAFLAELKEHFESKQAGLKVLEEKLKNEQVERNAQELELQSKEENIAKQALKDHIILNNPEKFWGYVLDAI